MIGTPRTTSHLHKHLFGRLKAALGHACARPTGHRPGERAVTWGAHSVSAPGRAVAPWCSARRAGRLPDVTRPTVPGRTGRGPRVPGGARPDHHTREGGRSAWRSRSSRPRTCGSAGDRGRSPGPRGCGSAAPGRSCSSVGAAGSPAPRCARSPVARRMYTRRPKPPGTVGEHVAQSTGRRELRDHTPCVTLFTRHLGFTGDNAANQPAGHDSRRQCHAGVLLKIRTPCSSGPHVGESQP